MTLEPKTVEPGYLRRWTREALALWGANFTLWFALMLAPCMLAVVLGQSLVTGLTLLVVAYATVHASLEFAVTAEHGRVRVSQLPGIMRAGVEGMGDELWRHRHVLVIAYTLAFALTMWVRFAAHGGAEPAPAKASLGVLDWLFGLDSPMLSAATMTFIGFQGLLYSSQLGYLNYPLRRMFGLDHAQASLLLAQASRKNVGATVTLELVVGFGSLLSIMLAPGLAPFLMCFFGSFCYVACRDMFGPGEPLHQPQGETAMQGAVEGAAG